MITHNAPVINPNTKFKDSPLMPAFNSLDMIEVIENRQPALWVYGHTHECDDQTSARPGSFPTSWDIRTDVAVSNVTSLINRVSRLSWKPSRMANSNFHVPEKQESDGQSNGRSRMSHKRTRRGASASWARGGTNSMWIPALATFSGNLPAGHSCTANFSST